MAAISWEDGSGNFPLPFFSPCFLASSLGQKGDLLAQRGGGKQAEMHDLSRAVWRENGKADGNELFPSFMF